MQIRPIARILAFAASSAFASHCAAWAQQKPMTRTFFAGAEERYQVTVAIRVETHGVSTERAGEKAYAQLYTHEADGQVSWRSARKIHTVSPNGTAAIEETLDHFTTNCEKDPTSKSFNGPLQKSVQDACASWQTTTALHYDEEALGLIHGLPVGTSTIDSDSSLLSLWLRRALRPSVVLAKEPIHFGARTERKVGSASAENSQPSGEESSEWLEAPGETPAAVWHVSQNLQWLDPPSQPNQVAPNVLAGKPPRRQLFYADSLNTVSLLDGSLLKASRSATRETKELLDPVPGLPDAPTFGSKFTITVTILRLP